MGESGIRITGKYRQEEFVGEDKEYGCAPVSRQIAAKVQQ
jgi:hypothetical protein